MRAAPVFSVPVLDKNQIKHYRELGYLKVPAAFTREQVDLIACWSDELLALPEVVGRHWVYWEKSLKKPEQKIVSRIENIAPFHAGFRELANILRGICDRIFGEPAVLFKEKINFKMPGGQGFKPHQDSQAGWSRYASRFCSVLVSIDDATIENGCLQIAGGHHTGRQYDDWTPLTESEVARMRFVPCPTKRGDIILFDSYTPHSSEPNMTEQVRRIYYATYNRLSEGDQLATYYAEKRKSYPPDIEREAGKEYVFLV
jgi:2-aminoethylphosphonate dioxygenase